MKWLIYIGLVCLTNVAYADTLGRLFSTPSERAALNRVRQIKKEIVPQKVEQASSLEMSSPEPLPRVIELQGYVKRSDGKQATVWVNHQALQEGTMTDEVSIGKLSATNNRIPIKLKANGQVVGLKAGQIYAPESGQVVEMQSGIVDQETVRGKIGD
jgi:hypothetical protein